MSRIIFASFIALSCSSAQFSCTTRITLSHKSVAYILSLVGQKIPSSLYTQDRSKYQYLLSHFLSQPCSVIPDWYEVIPYNRNQSNFGFSNKQFIPTRRAVHFQKHLSGQAEGKVANPRARVKIVRGMFGGLILDFLPPHCLSLVHLLQPACSLAWLQQEPRAYPRLGARWSPAFHLRWHTLQRNTWNYAKTISNIVCDPDVAIRTFVSQSAKPTLFKSHADLLSLGTLNSSCRFYSK